MPDATQIQTLIEAHAVPWAINIALALVIFVVGRWIAGVIVSVIKRLMSRARVDVILVNFVGSIAGALLLLVVIIAALNQLGFDTTSLIALVGAAGLAIGLALQDSLKNFAAGVMLIVFRPFTSGDFVEAAGISGIVEKINIFSSTFRTGDNREIIVPNGAIYSGVITNYSARETRRIDLVMGIGYSSDLKKAKEIITAHIEADERILKDPVPVVMLGDLAASSVDINVRPWTTTADYWDVRADLLENIKLSFDEAGISIPYPQMDVHISKED